MSKRKCTFNDSLKKRYPFIEKKDGSNVYCRTCLSTFTVSSGGNYHILKHIGTDKHKKAAAASACSTNFKTFISGVSAKKTQAVAIAEGIFSYHNVKHYQSFREMDCSSKIMKKVYDQSYSCARTKSEAIIVNVFAPWALKELSCDLDKASFVSIYTDSSNHGNIKAFPILVRYFDIEKGISVKLLEFKNLGGENSELVSDYVLNVLYDNNLAKKVVGFCADNTNMNFGGNARNGTNNIFSKLKSELKTDLFGIGCAAHIVNNTLHSAADCLPIDIELIMVKVYSYFYIYTVRVEELKDFCNYVSVEYQQILGYCKSRWLSMLPAIERLIAMFKPLKTYFLSQTMCPSVLKNFFNDQAAEFWLHFIQKQAIIFNDVILKIEGQTTSIFEVSSILSDLLLKYENRVQDKFISSDLKNLCGGSLNEQLLNCVIDFYQNCVLYLKKWICPFETFNIFSWMSLKTVPDWEDISKSLFKVQNVPNLAIDETQLYDEFLSLKLYLQKVINEWNEQKLNCEERWKKIFSYSKEYGISFENFSQLIQLIMCVPGTNAPTERIFSIMNKIWSAEKTQLNINTLKAMLIVKTNFDLSCIEFYSRLAEDECILEKISSSEKYNHVGTSA